MTPVGRFVIRVAAFWTLEHAPPGPMDQDVNYHFTDSCRVLPLFRTQARRLYINGIVLTTGIFRILKAPSSASGMVTGDFFLAG